MKPSNTRHSPPVILDFQRDAPHFGDEVSVRFRIGDEDLLVGLNKDGSLRPSLPLLVPNFATFGVACLRLAKQTGKSALELDEYGHELLFQMAGDDILVCSTMREKTVKCDYDVLFAEWLVFAEEVQRVVVLRHPEKRTYPYWRLITEDPDPITAASLTHPSWFSERDDCFK